MDSVRNSRASGPKDSSKTSAISNGMDEKLLKPYDPKNTEERIYKLWEESGFFAPEAHPPWVDNPSTNPNFREPFTIVLPPPNATGVLHLGHTLEVSMQDTMIRYNRMQGKKTLWLPGTDHAAIATDSKVTKILEKEGLRKKDIGREKFLKRVEEFVEESRKIKFSLGNVSLDKNLGSYYIDMRPALIHYTTNNIYNGVIDPNGVPMCRNNKELYYSTVNIAQYGFMLHAEWLENRDQKTLQILKHCLLVLNNLKTTKNNTSVWYNYVFDEKYKIDPPWPSAMAQGEIISFYLRMYQALNDENLLNTAIQAYEFLKFEYNNGGVRRFDEYGDLWFEEYPTPKPTFVLNGYIYTLFGLYDLYRVTGNTEVKKDIDKCIITLKKNIHKFSINFNKSKLFSLLKRLCPVLNNSYY